MVNTRKQYSILGATLRQLSLAVCVFALAFVANSVVHSRDAMEQRNAQIATVIGMAAAVPPNEYNTLALQFSEREKALNEREQAIVAREHATVDTLLESKRFTLLVLGGTGGILLLLILTNFYLDFRRTRRTGEHEEHELITRLK